MMAQKALGFVPTGFTNQETQKDFAEELGDLNPSEPEKRKELWQMAKKLGEKSGADHFKFGYRKC